VPGQHDSSVTQTDGAAGLAALDPRVPGLSVLHHPDLRRVGERAPLLSLAAGGEALLSRREPGFSVPGAAPGAAAPAQRRPLDHASLSRQPIRLRREGLGGVRLDACGSRTRVVVDGEPVTARTFAAGELDQGVVLLLGRHVALLLHFVDPVTVPGLPRYGLIGESPAIVALRLAIRKVADVEVPVLVRGETGSGKELAARAIHQASRRRAGPFVAVNMAAVPATLAAAELFGAVRGAYTGADRPRQGLFVQAHGGTLFLDEIGATPPEVQALLLRALESREVRPVGGEETRQVDVRVIAATDADLEAAAHGERFRAPLLYRLASYELRVPPLRQRRDDVGRLLVYFLEQELDAVGEQWRLASPVPWLDGELVARLAAYEWPGNVRQLHNVVRQLAIANRGETRACLPETVGKLLATPAVAVSSAPPPRRRKPSEIGDDELVELLRAHRFNLRGAAAALGISRTSLYALVEQCPRLRKAANLGREEIVAGLAAAGGDVDAAAAVLEVSSLGLKRRVRELGLA